MGIMSGCDGFVILPQDIGCLCYNFSCLLNTYDILIVYVLLPDLISAIIAINSLRIIRTPRCPRREEDQQLPPRSSGAWAKSPSWRVYRLVPYAVTILLKQLKCWKARRLFCVREGRATARNGAIDGVLVYTRRTIWTLYQTIKCLSVPHVL